MGRLEERGHVASPPRMGLWGRLQPFGGLHVPRALSARLTNYRGLLLGVCSPPVQWDGVVLYCQGFPSGVMSYTTAPLVRPLGPRNARLPCGHSGGSDDTQREERAPEVF